MLGPSLDKKTPNILNMPSTVDRIIKRRSSKFWEFCKNGQGSIKRTGMAFYVCLVLAEMHVYL